MFFSLYTCILPSILISSASKISLGEDIMPAPSAMSLLHPRLIQSVILPGSANTSLPCSKACDAVISEPDFSLASITIVISDSPDIIRFLVGKFILRGFVPSGNSDITPPQSFSHSLLYRLKLLSG